MPNTVKLSGFREMHQALGELTKATERSVLRRAATKALEPVLERAKQLVPVDEGNLRDSIVIGTSMTSGARRAMRGEPKGGVRVLVGTASRNAVPREFGTVRTAPQPFMRPAWDSESGKVLDVLAQELRVEIEKAATRAAKRRTRR